MPNDVTAAITRVPSKKIGPPESPLHVPPLPCEALAVVFRLNSVTGASLLTRYDVAISRSRNETGTGS